MEQFTKIMPLLWEIVGLNKKRSINITTKENEIIVSIWSGRRWKRFKGCDCSVMMDNLKRAYQLN